MSRLIWAVIRKDKYTKVMGSLFFSAFSTLLIGYFFLILLLSDYYGLDIPFWIGVLFVIIVFPILAYSFYWVFREGINKEK